MISTSLPNTVDDEESSYIINSDKYKPSISSESDQSFISFTSGKYSQLSLNTDLRVSITRPSCLSPIGNSSPFTFKRMTSPCQTSKALLGIALNRRLTSPQCIIRRNFENGKTCKSLDNPSLLSYNSFSISPQKKRIDSAVRIQSVFRSFNVRKSIKDKERNRIVLLNIFRIVFIQYVKNVLKRLSIHLNSYQNQKHMIMFINIVKKS